MLLAIAIATAILGPLSAIAETNLRRAIGFLLIGGVGRDAAERADGEADRRRPAASPTASMRC